MGCLSTCSGVHSAWPDHSLALPAPHYLLFCVGRFQTVGVWGEVLPMGNPQAWKGSCISREFFLGHFRGLEGWGSL